MWVAASACLLTIHPASAAGETLRIGWSQLRPAAQDGAGHGPPISAVAAPDRGETLSRNLGGRTIEIAGYLLPTDRDGDLVYEFLLVPWTGACSHMPAPPPNQIIRVTPHRPYRLSEIYEPVSVSGMLKPGLERTQLFILDGIIVLQSGYGIGSARVERAENVPDANPASGRMPWSFLKK